MLEGLIYARSICEEYSGIPVESSFELAQALKGYSLVRHADTENGSLTCFAHMRPTPVNCRWRLVPSKVDNRPKAGYSLRGSVKNSAQVRRLAISTISMTELVNNQASEQLSWHSIIQKPGRCYTPVDAELGSPLEHIYADKDADRSMQVLDLLRIVKDQKFEISKALKNTNRHKQKKSKINDSAINVTAFIEAGSHSDSQVHIAAIPRLEPQPEEEIHLSVQLTGAQSNALNYKRICDFLEHVGYHAWLLQRARKIMRQAFEQFSTDGQFRDEGQKILKDFLVEIEPSWEFDYVEPDLSPLIGKVDSLLRLSANWNMTVTRLERLLRLSA